MASRIRLDSAGMEAMLKSGAVADEVNALASDVAMRIDEVAHDGPVPVDTGSSTTDRARAHVVMMHAAALAIEAKRSPLASAARAAGLQVRTY